MLLAGLRLFLLLFVLFILLPQLQLRFDRQSWPDVVLIIDDSRSMGEPDDFTDDRCQGHGPATLAKFVRGCGKLPARVNGPRAELEASLKEDQSAKTATSNLKAEIDHLDDSAEDLGEASSAWPSRRPGPRSRLQLVQALLAQPDLDWLDYLVNKRRTKLHIYHLDAAGPGHQDRLRPGDAGGEITEADPQQLAAAQQAVAQLEAEANDSRLGTAVRQVIDHYRGGSATVIMFTDGVTTRDETIEQAADYAANKGMQLYFVGIGDAHEVRDFHLYDLQVEDVVRVNDTLNFQAKLSRQGHSRTCPSRSFSRSSRTARKSN